MNGVELIRVIHDVLSIVYTIGKVVYRFCNDIHRSARKPAHKGKENPPETAIRIVKAKPPSSANWLAALLLLIL